MNTRQLEYFIAVADELNFTRAAEKMYVSQTAVTQQIKALEELIGVPLFARTKKKVVLTPAGQVFYTEANHILNHIDDAFAHARDATAGIAGNLTVGFTNGTGNTLFANRLQEFNQKNPQILLEFKQDNPSGLLERLKSRELDIILTPIFDVNYYTDIAYKVILHTPMVVVLPIDHKLANRRFIRRKDLANENLILACTPESKLGEDSVIIDRFYQAGITPKVLGKIENMEVVLMMISVHMGVTIMPSYMPIPSDNGSKVVSVPFENSEEGVDLAVAWIPDNNSASLARFLDFLDD